MRLRSFLVALVLVSTVSAAAGQTLTPEATAEAVAEIRALVAAEVAAFNRKDAASLAALYTDDADVIDSITYGYWWRGSDQIKRGLEVVLGGPLAFAKESLRLEKVRFLSSGVAVIHVWGEMAFPASNDDFQYRTTDVVVNEGKQWKIVATSTSTASFGGPQLQRMPGIQVPEEGETTVVSSLPADATNESRGDAEAAIRAEVEALLQAYNTHAVVAERYFVEDADFVTAPALWWRGRDEIERGLNNVLTGPFASMTWTADIVEKLRFVTPTIAVLHVRREAELAGRRPDFSGPVPYPLRIMVQQGGIWQIVALHNGTVAPPPAELEVQLDQVLLN